MKKIIFAIIPIFLQGCLSVVPLRGSYNQDVVVSKIAQPFEKVWTAAVEVIVYKNLPINVIDKSSGIISSFQSSYTQFSTYEKAKGAELMHPNAYVVSHRSNYYSKDMYLLKASSIDNSLYYPFRELTGRWKIFIKPISANETQISVTLGGFEFSESASFDKLVYTPQIYSLKNFEKEIVDAIFDKANK